MAARKTNKTLQICVRLAPIDNARIAELAALREVSPAQLIRALVKEESERSLKRKSRP